jgi:hypothetical protein
MFEHELIEMMLKHLINHQNNSCEIKKVKFISKNG